MLIAITSIPHNSTCYKQRKLHFRNVSLRETYTLLFIYFRYNVNKARIKIGSLNLTSASQGRRHQRHAIPRGIEY